jgi:hypothetical protein
LIDDQATSAYFFGVCGRRVHMATPREINLRELMCTTALSESTKKITISFTFGLLFDIYFEAIHA